MFVQAVVSSFVSTPSNIDRALLLSVTTISNIRGSGDFSRVWKQKCEHISSNNWIPQTGFCRKAKQKIHSSKQYSSIKCDFLEDPSQSSDLNPTDVVEGHKVQNEYIHQPMQICNRVSCNSTTIWSNTNRLKHMNALNQHRIHFNYKKKRFKNSIALPLKAL